MAAWIAVAGYLGLIFYVSNQSRPFDLSIGFPGFDILAHLGEYGLLAVLLRRACELTPNEWIRAEALYLTIVTIALYGLSDELHQAVIPGRSSEWKDWFIDVLGASAVQWAWPWLRRFFLS